MSATNACGDSGCKRRKRGWLSSCRDSFVFYSALILLAAHFYGMFSHGVHSPTMDFAFAVPLLGAAVEFCFRKISGGRVCAKAWNLCKEMLRVSVDGFVFFCFNKGVFDIAGVPPRYSHIFLIVGAVFFCASTAAFVMAITRRTAEAREAANI